MRVDQLTFTRFIAALTIVLYHFGDKSHSLYKFFAVFISNIGVSYFFVLSGFVMIVAYHSDKIVPYKYYINRLARIYPIYLIALLLVVIPRLVFHKNIDSISLSLNVLLLQSWIPTYSQTVHAPGWSLSVEFFFYLFFPIIMNTWYRKFTFNKLLLLIILFCIITQLILNILLANFQTNSNFINDFILYHPIMHLNEFLMGNITGLAFIKLKGKSINVNVQVLLLIVFLFLFFMLLKYPLPLNYHNGFLAIVFCPIILLLAISKNWITNILKLKPLVYLGDISYGIYILQVPIYYYFASIFKYLNIKPYFICYLGVLLLLSSLSYSFIEKPIRNRIKKALVSSKV
jgi:peptidoglycan/LPS O-acetylase OafA/YrhL